MRRPTSAQLRKRPAILLDPALPITRHFFIATLCPIALPSSATPAAPAAFESLHPDTPSTFRSLPAALFDFAEIQLPLGKLRLKHGNILLRELQFQPRHLFGRIPFAYPSRLLPHIGRQFGFLVRH